MPPKKGGKKKKEAEPQEPEHDGSWEKAVETGLWELPPTSLPDANTWPTWGALRERVLTACKHINILGSAAVRDTFVSELVKLSPPELHTLELRGSVNLTKVVMSPATACPKLAQVDLYGCPKLLSVLIQSQSLTSLKLSNCGQLTKVIIQCPNLEKLEASGCPGLQTLLLWSDKVTELDITDSKSADLTVSNANCKFIMCDNTFMESIISLCKMAEAMTKRELYCPNLLVRKLVPTVPPPRPVKPVHPPIADIVKDSIHEEQEEKARIKQEFKNSAETKTTIPAMWKPLS